MKIYPKASDWPQPQSWVCPRHCFNIVNKPLNEEIVYGQRCAYSRV